MTALRLSVVVPTFNGASILGQTFAALGQESTDFPWEIVCADNGSTDDTRRRLENIEGSFESLRIVDAAQQRGVGHARNVGVAAARGELLVFIDQDDVIRPGYLAAMARALGEQPIVAARMDGRTLNPGARDRIVQVDEVPVAYDRMPGASGGSMGMRRSAFDELGGFDTSVGVSDDIDLCWRAQLRGLSIGLVPDAVLMYRYRSNVRALYQQGVRYGVAASIMHRRFAELAPPRTPNPRRARADLLPRLLRRRPGAVHDIAHALGWRVGMVKARKLDVPVLRRDDLVRPV